MQLIVIGSSSAGNGYLLMSESGDTLLIEAGVPFLSIKKALGYNLRNVAALVSHSHGDHSKSIRDVMAAGVQVYSGRDTFVAKGMNGHHRAHVLTAGQSIQIMSFTVLPFEVNHDVPCLGFLIRHEECGTVLFLTDTCYSDYTFPGLNNIIVECNHSQDIMRENGTPRFLRDRVIGSHMSLDTCKGLLSANDLSAVHNIVLIHLSDKNSDEARFQREVQELTGKTVTIATAGLSIPFNKNPI